MKGFDKIEKLMDPGRWPHPEIPTRQMLWVLIVTCLQFMGDYPNWYRKRPTVLFRLKSPVLFKAFPWVYGCFLKVVTIDPLVWVVSDSSADFPTHKTYIPVPTT